MYASYTPWLLYHRISNIVVFLSALAKPEITRALVYRPCKCLYLAITQLSSLCHLLRPTESQEAKIIVRIPYYLESLLLV